jgi:glucan 1,3-beta-glucosidase
LRAHWNRFITRDDFAWLADVGIDTVRIPLGHWIFGAPYPYHEAYGTGPHPFVEGGIDVLDRAFDWASELGLRVMLDLHAAPGCQKGFDNGGIQNVCEWHTREEYAEHSVDVLRRLAERYCGQPALAAIQLLNEPRWDIPTEYLRQYYVRAHHAIRRHCAIDDVAIVFHDGFRSHRVYIDSMRSPEFENVVFAVHRYQCFDPNDLALDVPGHLHKAAVTWRIEADDIQRELALPAIVGEWSLGLDIKAVSLGAQSDSAIDRLDPFQIDLAMRGYGAAQLLAFERYFGWFFWSYRTETTPAWCFRECVERGWLPQRFQ